MTFWTFITSFDWTDRTSLIARARARARFFCFLYCLFPRSHYCARPMRFGLKASTEKAWKDTGKSFKNANSRKKSEAPGYATTQAVMSSGPMRLLLASTVPGFQKFFFLAWADVRREMCAECTKATKLFAPAFWGPGQYKDLLQNRKPRMLCIQCRHNMGRHLREQS